MYCNHCGSQVADQAVVCVKCGVATGRGAVDGDRSKSTSRILYVLLAIFLGYFGVHNFVAGYTKNAIIQLAITICTCGIGVIGVFIWNIVEVCTVKQDANGIPFT